MRAGIARLTTILAATSLAIPGAISSAVSPAVSPGDERPATDRRTGGPSEKEKAPPDGTEKWKPPSPPGARQRAAEREKMVASQIARSTDGRKPVRSRSVLEAMRRVPRHAFVPARLRKYAYADSPLPIGHGQTISQPYIVAWMSELLELEPGHRVLEIGSGSGYQAAVLAHLTPHVFTVEIVEPLARRARQVLGAEGYRGVQTRRSDGYLGWAEKGPFDAIIVTCAAGHLPPALWKQLKPGGRIVVPIGSPHAVQRLVLLRKTPEGKRRSKTLGPVRFVPLTRPKGSKKRT